MDTFTTAYNREQLLDQDNVRELLNRVGSSHWDITRLYELELKINTLMCEYHTIRNPLVQRLTDGSLSTEEVQLLYGILPPQ